MASQVVQAPEHAKKDIISSVYSLIYKSFAQVKKRVSSFQHSPNAHYIGSADFAILGTGATVTLIYLVYGKPTGSFRVPHLTITHGYPRELMEHNPI